MNTTLMKILIFQIIIAWIKVKKTIPINLTDYSYPHPEAVNESKYTIAIWETNDIHGYGWPVEYTDPWTSEIYFNGGFNYWSTYIKILRDEWKERFMWLDGGDHASGGLEYTWSKGDIVTDFFNYNRITACTLGNHDYNDGMNAWKERMKKSNFDFIVANIQNKTTNEFVFLPKQVLSKVYKVGEVRVGIIGLTNNKIAVGNYRTEGINFLQYKEVILEQTHLLKEKRVDCVILWAHSGMRCYNGDNYEDINILKLWTKNHKQKNCKEFEGFIDLIKSLPENTIDGIIAGHSHDINYHWIGNIPVVASVGRNFTNVWYLTFNKTPMLNNNSNTTQKFSYKLDSTVIEGPIPICSKIFDKSKQCPRVINSKDHDSFGQWHQFTYHNVEIHPDPEVVKLMKKWDDMISPLKTPICFSPVVWAKNMFGESLLQNIVVDIFKKTSKADIAIINADGLRITLHPGKITKLDMFSMFPFDNYVCTVEMTGAEILKMFEDITTERAIFPTSGLEVTYKLNPIKFVKARLLDGTKYQEIIQDKLYKVASFDYLFGGNIEFSKVVKWYKLRNYKCYKLAKDTIGNYLQRIKIIEEKDFYDVNYPRVKFVK